MKHLIRYGALLALGALGTLAAAQSPSGFAAAETVSETIAGSVTLPSSERGSLVMAPCSGCPLTSFRASASTTYFINERQVSLAELKAIATAQPQIILTVSYAAKSAALISVSAAVATKAGQ